MNRQTAGTMGVCLLVAAMSAACGSESAGSSVAPSAIAAASGAASGSSSGVTTTGERSTSTPADAQLLRGEGVISRVLESTACPALTFEIDGATFKVSADTRYDNGRCEDLEVGARIAWAGAKRAHETPVFVQRVRFAPLSR